jgi:hypothetical protein
MKERKSKTRQLNEKALYYHFIKKGYSKFEAKEIVKRAVDKSFNNNY